MKGWILYNRDSSTEPNEDTKHHGRNRLLEAAKRKGIDLQFYSPNQFSLLVNPGKTTTIIRDDAYTTLPDFIIPRLFIDDISYLGLSLLRHFEQLGVYVCNHVESIAICKDKLRTMQCLNQAHIPVPRTMLMKYPMSMKYIRSEIGFPLVIKVISGSQGKGVHLCESEAALDELMGVFSYQMDQRPMLIQEFIADSYGRDLRVIVVGGQAVACMQRSASSGFRANYSRDGHVKAYPMTPEIKTLAEASAKAIGLDILGLDLLFNHGEFTVCEANAMPGFKGIESATHVDIADKIIDHIQAVVRRRNSIFRS
ncbi:MAG: RimK family alpha-L-glutamate ligase [Legionellaceae bacterium]|nr:RimK family alpha-L-glutamate ligase [Legionellaceae bacterium]